MSTPYANQLTRTHWAGADADVDIHLEVYQADIDGSFQYDSIFRSTGLTNYRSVADQSNTYRGDRIGNVQVLGRRSGQSLSAQRIANARFHIVVEALSYVRTVVDWQDDWTSPDFQQQYSREHAIAHSKAFDTNHIIQLTKASEWKAPPELGTAFHDGINNTLTGLNAATTGEAKADIIVQAHKAQLAALIKRDLSNLADFRTLVYPDEFNILLDHGKLQNVQFQGGGSGVGNNFATRRIAYLNGVPLIETPRFPTSAITDHILGPDFNLTAAQAKTRLITFLPQQALLTVEAHPMSVKYDPSQRDFDTVLDSFHFYNVGIRRGDVVAALRLE